METNNPDLKTIASIAAESSIKHLIAKSHETQQVPQAVPMVPPKKRPRSSYTEQQVQHAIKLSFEVGATEAEKLTGVSRWTIYKYGPNGRDKSVLRPGCNKPVKKKRLKYSEALLKKAFEQGMTWFNGQTCPREFRFAQRECINRAATKFGIKGNYLWSLYTLRHPVLGFAPRDL